MFDEPAVSPFSIELEEFKQMAKKFLNRINDKSVSLDALEGAKSAFVLHYLNFRGSPLDVNQAEALFTVIMREYTIRTLLDDEDEDVE